MSRPAVTAVTAADGARIATHDLGGSGPPLVAAHAAGFHGLVLGPLARHLAPDFHVIAFDSRGHGDSRLPPGPALDWYGLATDVLAVVDGLGLHHPFGFGHSSGGTAVLMAEQARPGTFAAIYCYEPVIVPADPPLGRDEDSWLAAQVRRRRTTFASREEARQHYASKPPLDALDPDALRAYVDHGFADTGDGRMRLKCHPDDEAQVYEMATAHDAYTRLPEVGCPVTVACGSASDGCSPKRGRTHAERLPAGRHEELAGLGHFGPLQDPAAVATSVRRAFAAVRRRRPPGTGDHGGGGSPTAAGADRPPPPPR
ncbi:MAG: alpha/beta fold hydrolase [Acidimicrobiales bacterium]